MLGGAIVIIILYIKKNKATWLWPAVAPICIYFCLAIELIIFEYSGVAEALNEMYSSIVDLALGLAHLAFFICMVVSSTICLVVWQIKLLWLPKNLS